MSFKFQVNLRGIIELLSNHLYASPEVYVRELLQNAVDAITARRGHPGRIRILLDRPGHLVFEDDGIGLTEAEVHRFLATIGESSKRDGADFIGRFGIGLLSCFVVSDEIVLVTRAEGHAAIEWRGKVDGTYTVRTLDASPSVGTRVELVAKPGAEPWFQPGKVIELVTRYGGLLPHPIEIVHGDERVSPNAEPPVFRRAFRDEATRRRAALAYGKSVFGTEFLDAIFLRAEAGDIDGVALVSRTETSPGARRADRVYVKGMLLAESAEDLLPPWAGFVRVIVDARDLRPTASREALYHDAALAAAQSELGRALCDYLAELPERDETLLRRIVVTHGTWLKAMCLENDDLCRAVIDWLPFETTLGVMSLGELRRREPVVRYAPSVDLYRQLAQVAAAEGIAIVNAGYIHDTDVLERLPAVLPGTRVEAVRVDDVLHAFEDLDLDELDGASTFLRAADTSLRPFRCIAELKRFAPDTIPVLFASSARAEFRRTAKRASEAAGGLWGSVLDKVVESADDTSDQARLVFNHRNPLVRRLVDHAHDRTLLHHTVRALYTQALMLGHHPLDTQELAAMNESLLGLVELATVYVPRGKAEA